MTIHAIKSHWYILIFSTTLQLWRQNNVQVYTEDDDSYYIRQVGILK